MGPLPIRIVFSLTYPSQLAQESNYAQPTPRTTRLARLLESALSSPQPDTAMEIWSKLMVYSRRGIGDTRLFKIQELFSSDQAAVPREGG